MRFLESLGSYLKENWFSPFRFGEGSKRRRLSGEQKEDACDDSPVLVPSVSQSQPLKRQKQEEAHDTFPEHRPTVPLSRKIAEHKDRCWGMAHNHVAEGIASRPPLIDVSNDSHPLSTAHNHQGQDPAETVKVVREGVSSL